MVQGGTVRGLAATDFETEISIMAKEVKCTKRYISADDVEGKQSYFAGASALEFRFANGETETVKPNDLDDSIKLAAMFHGLSQKLGDAYASSKDADEAYDKFMSLKERIEIGEWLAERQSAGPRISQVIRALVAAKAASGVTITEEDMAAKYHALDEDQKKAIVKDPRVDAQLQKIKAEAAAARAAKAAEAAQGAEGDIAI